MEERDFFDEKQEKKTATLNCPHCHQAAEYEITWVVRTKKRQLAGRAEVEFHIILRVGRELFGGLLHRFLQADGGGDADVSGPRGGRK